MYVILSYANLLRRGPDVFCARGHPHWTSKVPATNHTHFPEVEHRLVTEPDFRVLLGADVPLPLSHSVLCSKLLCPKHLTHRNNSLLPPVYLIGLCNTQINHIISMVSTNGINRSKPSIPLVSTQLEKWGQRVRDQQQRSLFARSIQPRVGGSCIVGGTVVVTNPAPRWRGLSWSHQETKDWHKRVVAGSCSYLQRADFPWGSLLPKKNGERRARENSPR